MTFHFRKANTNKSFIEFYQLFCPLTLAFTKELSMYKQGKGSVQFPINEPMPLQLIARIVQFRVAEVLAKK
jgi:hypothetical protein